MIRRRGLSASLLAGLIGFFASVHPVAAVQFGRCDVSVGTALSTIASAGVDDSGKPVLVVLQTGSGGRVLRITIDPASLVRACNSGVVSETLALGSFTPQALVVGDLNDDRRLDLLLAGGDGTSGHDVAMLAGIGNAQFSGQATFLRARDGSNSLAVSDVDRDGASDLVVGSGADSSVTVIYSGTTTTDPLSVQGVSSANLAVGFVNADGRPDIVVGSSASGRLTGLFQGATRAFSISSSSAALSTRSLSLSDLDGDLIGDLLVVRNNDAKLDLYLGPIEAFESLTAPTSSLTTGTGPVAIATGDLTGDAETDVAVANQDEGSVSLFVGDGLGGLSAKPDQAGCRATPATPKCPVSSRPTALLAADAEGNPLDLDGDGLGDIVVSTANGILSFLLSNPAAANPTLTPTNTPITPGPSATSTPTRSATPDSRCCSSHSNPGCSDSGSDACSTCVCNNDERCCREEWDDICVGFARSQLCADSCQCPEFTPTATPTEIVTPNTPTVTGTVTETPTATGTSTATGTPTATRTGSLPPATRTATASPTVTGTPPTVTRTPSNSPTSTPTPTVTATFTVQACVGGLCINGTGCNATPTDTSATVLWLSLAPALLMLVRRSS